MKNKMNVLFVSVLVLVSGSFALSASAQEAVAVKPEKAVEAQGAKSGSSDVATTTLVTTETTADAQSSQSKIKEEKSKNNKAQINGEAHRNTMAVFVRSLLAIADREGGIRQEVRVIAEQQNETKDRASDLINAVESRSKVKTFFIGTSYKNLGELRSQMVQTKNQIDQLKRLADKAENEQSKAELQAQIQVLEQQEAGINTFIAQNESKFSLFGWAIKLFRK
ncbi:MAG: hypothetical protein ACD_67C00031G0001 [uncultured bacterium]|nr:MAG: hypothetical protein ACD_67C00031G0001 [uncultured bacterium]